MSPWITYRTRFLVKAKPLSASLTFTDILGRQQSGVKGDYLVESCDGVLHIAPRTIFEDIYVPLLASGKTRSKQSSPERDASPLSSPQQVPRKSPQSIGNQAFNRSAGGASRTR